MTTGQKAAKLTFQLPWASVRCPGWSHSWEGLPCLVCPSRTWGTSEGARCSPQERGPCSCWQWLQSISCSPARFWTSEGSPRLSSCCWARTSDWDWTAPCRLCCQLFCSAQDEDDAHRCIAPFWQRPHNAPGSSPQSPSRDRRTSC